jgi:transcriptional regulator with XRE-family HTH domain
MKRSHSEDAYVKHLGQAISTLRLKLGISQEELAYRARLHRTYIGAVERAERNVTIVSLYRIASALGISPAVVLQEAEALITQ